MFICRNNKTQILKIHYLNLSKFIQSMQFIKSLNLCQTAMKLQCIIEGEFLHAANEKMKNV